MDVEVDVGVAAERALLHLAVGDAQVAERQPELLEAASGVGRAADVGLGDDLQERDARAVEVDLGEPAGGVRQLAGVLLEVDAGQPAPAARRRRPSATGISSQPPWLNGRSYWLIW